MDYDAEGNLVGIDIDRASRKLNLRELVTTHLPLEAVASELNHNSYFETRSLPGFDSCAPAIATSRFSHLCLPRRSLGEGGSLASPRLHCISAAPAALDRYLAA